MALDMHFLEGEIMLYSPVLKYTGTSSFSLVEITNLDTGSPISRARIPPVRFPKLPEGTLNTALSVLSDEHLSHDQK